MEKLKETVNGLRETLDRALSDPVFDGPDPLAVEQAAISRSCSMIHDIVNGMAGGREDLLGFSEQIVADATVGPILIEHRLPKMPNEVKVIVPGAGSEADIPDTEVQIRGADSVSTHLHVKKPGLKFVVQNFLWSPQAYVRKITANSGKLDILNEIGSEENRRKAFGG